MFLKFLGILDGIAALSLVLAILLPSWWILACGLYLMIKGGIFLISGDAMSLMDVGIAVYLFLAAYTLTNTIVTALASLFLLQKAAFSLLS